MVKESVIIIGPMGVGKTSVSKILAETLDLEYIDVDELRWDYFNSQPDFDHDMMKKLHQSGDAAGTFQYMKPFEARYVEHIVNAYSSAVLDFGAGYTVYEDDALFLKVKACLAPYRHVVFLRYSPDHQESLNALQVRHAEAPEALYAMLNQQFINSPCNRILAKLIIDTKNKTIEEVVQEVITKLNI